MTQQNHDTIRAEVREHYGKVAQSQAGCGCAPGCCGTNKENSSLELGYSQEDLAAVPAGADLGLGCGNPQAIASLQPGETVLDLGSGAGIDCFLASRQVGEKGQVIGVDMTPQMIAKARENARRVESKNVEFRLGEIEHLPVADASVDVILSNCVLNLSPEKEEVFREAFRVLRPGGRLAISDVVTLRPLPEALKQRLDALVGCVSGAASPEQLRSWLSAVGFQEPQVDLLSQGSAIVEGWLPEEGVERYIASASIRAIKPSFERQREAQTGAKTLPDQAPKERTGTTAQDTKEPPKASALSQRSCCGPSCCTGDEA